MNIFTDEEVNILNKLRKYVFDSELLKDLKNIISSQTFEKLSFCHNDLNQLNIFLIEEEVVLIDYGYCSYNYPLYDIANFLNESSINYQHPEPPYYEFSEINFPNFTQLEFIIVNYLI